MHHDEQTDVCTLDRIGVVVRVECQTCGTIRLDARSVVVRLRIDGSALFSHPCRWCGLVQWRALDPRFVTPLLAAGATLDGEDLFERIVGGAG